MQSSLARLAGLNLAEKGILTYSDDGRINIKISDESRVPKFLTPAIAGHLKEAGQGKSEPNGDSSSLCRHELSRGSDQAKPTPLNVVLQVVGTRGDVQPFVALGRVLKYSYGHRVRIATHAVFQSFVEDNDLEFFNIGGDPTALMAFMVQNPRLLPNMETVKRGDIGKRRRDIFEIMRGCWQSCFQAGTNVAADKTSYSKEFVADAIIANPPSFAHIHCAQKLGIPLHLMFTQAALPERHNPC